MATTFECPKCNQRLEVDCEEPSLIGTQLNCPTCSASFLYPREPSPANKGDEPGQPQWRRIVQEYRNFVPIIEGASRLGAGLLVSSDGFILTNAHVVDGLKSLLVSLHNGTKAKGTLVHRHEEADLAIVKAALQTQNFFDLNGRTTSSYDAGDEVLAIGHPRGLTFTATRGIVSEAKRKLHDGVFVQTDVSINPGNSGGPLLDTRGNLVGINTQIRTDSRGLGFAIPSEQVISYWNEFSKNVLSGKIRVPSDEQICAIEQSLSPFEVLQAGVLLADFSLQEERSGDGRMWKIETEDGEPFFAFIDENTYSVVTSIARLNKKHISDAHLLLGLLSWNEDIPYVRFFINKENALFLGYRRSFEDLDVSEVCKSLLAMAAAIKKYASQVKEYLSE